MFTNLFLFGTLVFTFAMVTAKRLASLVASFRAQSFFLFLFTLLAAASKRDYELYTVAALVLILKVVVIPKFLFHVAKKINVKENLGLFINPSLSLLIVLGLTYLAYQFSGRIIINHDKMQGAAFTVSLSVTLTGMFIMVFRMKALTQIIGLLVMENGLFLAASAVSGGMPFLVEIVIFFDVFVCVVIMGLFVYKINRLFTHIDVNKLTELKG